MTVEYRELRELLNTQLSTLNPCLRVRVTFEEDRRAGVAGVWLPFALERKYPNAGKEWAWQWAFPSQSLSVDPRAALSVSSPPSPQPSPPGEGGEFSSDAVERVPTGRDDFHIVPFVPLGTENIPEAGRGRFVAFLAFRNHAPGPSTVVRMDHGRGGTRPWQAAASSGSAGGRQGVARGMARCVLFRRRQRRTPLASRR